MVAFNSRNGSGAGGSHGGSSGGGANIGMNLTPQEREALMAPLAQGRGPIDFILPGLDISGPKTLGVLAAVAAMVGTVGANHVARREALNAPTLSLADVPALIVKIKAWDAQRQDVGVGSINSQPSVPLSARLEGVASLISISNTATMLKDAKDNPQYEYALADRNGLATDIVLKTGELLSHDGRPMQVAFVANLLNAQTDNGKIVVTTVGMPKLWSFPLCGEAILSIKEPEKVGMP